VDGQFFLALLRLRRLAVDENLRGTFLIFDEEIEVILIELTFAHEDEAFFELLCILLKESGRITFRVRQ